MVDTMQVTSIKTDSQAASAKLFLAPYKAYLTQHHPKKPVHPTHVQVALRQLCFYLASLLRGIQYGRLHATPIWPQHFGFLLILLILLLLILLLLILLLPILLILLLFNGD